MKQQANIPKFDQFVNSLKNFVEGQYKRVGSMLSPHGLPVGSFYNQMRQETHETEVLSMSLSNCMLCHLDDSIGCV